MKKGILLSILIVPALSVLAFAAKSDLPVDGKGIRVNQFAPSGKKSVELTVASQNINHADDIAVEIYAPTACIFRLQSTATKQGIKLTLPANVRIVRGVNAATPYINYSGCTSGQVQVQ